MENQEPRSGWLWVVDQNRIDEIAKSLDVAFQELETAFRVQTESIANQSGLLPAEGTMIKINYLEATLHAIRRSFLFAKINSMYELEWSEKDNTYDAKRAVVKSINEILRRYDSAFLTEDAWEACILYAIPSKDGEGRYTFENRRTKKRTGHYRSLYDCGEFPLPVIADIPRKEGVIERRKKDQ